MVLKAKRCNKVQRSREQHWFKNIYIIFFKRTKGIQSPLRGCLKQSIQKYKIDKTLQVTNQHLSRLTTTANLTHLLPTCKNILLSLCDLDLISFGPSKPTFSLKNTIWKMLNKYKAGNLFHEILSNQVSDISATKGKQQDKQHLEKLPQKTNGVHWP